MIRGPGRQRLVGREHGEEGCRKQCATTRRGGLVKNIKRKGVENTVRNGGKKIDS